MTDSTVGPLLSSRTPSRGGVAKVVMSPSPLSQSASDSPTSSCELRTVSDAAPSPPSHFFPKHGAAVDTGKSARVIAADDRATPCAAALLLQIEQEQAWAKEERGRLLEQVRRPRVLELSPSADRYARRIEEIRAVTEEAARELQYCDCAQYPGATRAPPPPPPPLATATQTSPLSSRAAPLSDSVCADQPPLLSPINHVTIWDDSPIATSPTPLRRDRLSLSTTPGGFRRASDASFVERKKTPPNTVSLPSSAATALSAQVPGRPATRLRERIAGLERRLQLIEAAARGGMSSLTAVEDGTAADDPPTHTARTLLRWDTARSANVRVSRDEGTCVGSAREALRDIQRHLCSDAGAVGQADDALCYYVPIYAMGGGGWRAGIASFTVTLRHAETFLNRESGSIPAAAVRVAVGVSAGSFAPDRDQDTPVFLLSSDGFLMTGVHTVGVPFCPPFHVPAVVTVFLDMSRGYIGFHLNGRSLGTAFRLCFDDPPQTLYPFVVFSDSGIAATLSTP